MYVECISYFKTLQVVFLPEVPNAYIPVPPLRSRPSSNILAETDHALAHGQPLPAGGPAPQQVQQQPTGVGAIAGADSGSGSTLEQLWRAPPSTAVEGWERDYRRYRFNNTRVQRK